MTGPSSSCVPWSTTPPDTILSLPTLRRGRYGLQVIPHPGHPGRLEVSGPHAPWPARSHPYASPRPFLAPSQGWLPARAGSPLAGRDLHPLDDTQSFMKASYPPIPFDQPCLVALHFLLCCRYCPSPFSIFSFPRFSALSGLCHIDTARAFVRAFEVHRRRPGSWPSACERLAEPRPPVPFIPGSAPRGSRSPDLAVSGGFLGRLSDGASPTPPALRARGAPRPPSPRCSRRLATGAGRPRGGAPLSATAVLRRPRQGHGPPPPAPDRGVPPPPAQRSDRVEHRSRGSPPGAPHGKRPERQRVGR